MTRQIVYTTPEGGIAIIVPTADIGEEETEEDYLDRIQQHSLPTDALNVNRVDIFDIPKDRVFRNAWKQGGAANISVDMPKARTIHMGRIRGVRNDKLNALDKEWIKFIGQKQELKAETVEALRQKLRDLPQSFDLSVHATPEDLKAAWPDEIERRSEESLRLPEPRRRPVR